MEKHKNFSAYTTWIIICIVWGTTYLAIRIGVKDIPPVLFAGLRWLIAGPILLVILFLRGYKLPSKKDFIHLTIVGICLLGIGNGLVVFSEQTIPSRLAALLITTTPFWIVMIESFMPHGKKINVLILSGVVSGFVGIGFIFGDNIGQLFNAEYFIGVIGLLLAVIGWSAGSVYSKYNKVSVHPLMSAAVEMTVAGIILTIMALMLGEFANFSFTPNGLYAFIYLIIIGSLVGYASYIYAITHLPVSFVSTYAYINPIIALFLGWFVLDEAVTLNIILASVIILVGVMLVKKGTEIHSLNNVKNKS